MDNEFKVGDRVKVTLEGKISYVNRGPYGYDVDFPDLGEVECVPANCIEKLPDPPVEVKISREDAEYFVNRFPLASPEWQRLVRTLKTALEVENNE